MFANMRLFVTAVLALAAVRGEGLHVLVAPVKGIQEIMTSSEAEALDTAYHERRRGWQKYFVDPPKNADPTGYTCSAAKKQPKNGSLRCSNGEDNIGHGDSCQVRCAKGFIGYPYTVLNCMVKQDTRTNELVGIWDQKKAASCVSKFDSMVTDAPNPEVITTTTTTNAPVISFASGDTGTKSAKKKKSKRKKRKRKRRKRRKMKKKKANATTPAP